MKKSLIYISLLVLMFFLPAKTADMILNTDSREVEEEKDWVIETPIDTSQVENVKDESPEKEVQTPSNDTQEETQKNWWEYPDEIYPTKRNGDDLLVLVNKQYKLPSTYVPTDLVKASNSGIRRGESYYLRNILINDLTNLVNDAKGSGIDLSIVSGYRSYQTQLDTYNYWLARNDNDVAYVDTFSARAGHSQHQLGTAIDFSSSEIGDVLGDSFTNTQASLWLVENSYKYGFVISFPKGFEYITGYRYESWHYRYIGVENALDMVSSGIILENYLKSKN